METTISPSSLFTKSSFTLQPSNLLWSLQPDFTVVKVKPDNLYNSTVWITPSYGVLDIHASYALPFELGPAKPKVFLHILNALDETYIQDAVDNSPYNAWDQSSNADDAEVFFGLPLSFNLGLSFVF